MFTIKSYAMRLNRDSGGLWQNVATCHKIPSTATYIARPPVLDSTACFFRHAQATKCSQVISVADMCVLLTRNNFKQSWQSICFVSCIAMGDSNILVLVLYDGVFKYMKYCAVCIWVGLGILSGCLLCPCETSNTREHYVILQASAWCIIFSNRS